MAQEAGDIRDASIQDRLYEIASAQGGYLSAQQAVSAGVPRSTLTYHARDGGALDRVGHGIYRLRRFPASPHEHVIRLWLPFRRSGGVISHDSGLEMLDLADVIADEVHITLPRSKRGLTIPDGVRAHFTEHPPTGRDRRLVAGVPVTSPERTIADVVRSHGWNEHVDIAVRRALRTGQTTLPRLSRQLPKTWQARLRAATKDPAS